MIKNKLLLKILSVSALAITISGFTFGNAQANGLKYRGSIGGCSILQAYPYLYNNTVRSPVEISCRFSKYRDFIKTVDADSWLSRTKSYGLRNLIGVKSRSIRNQILTPWGDEVNYTTWYNCRNKDKYAYDHNARVRLTLLDGQRIGYSRYYSVSKFYLSSRPNGTVLSCG